MRRSGMTDYQGRRIVDKPTSREKTSLDALDHRAMKKERQAGKAWKKQFKLTQGFRHLGFWHLGFDLRLLVRDCNV
jgi:hypothetical protein